MVGVKKYLAGQFATFAAVGAIGTGAHYLTLVLLVKLAGMAPVLASTVGFLIGALTNYALNYRITFSSSNPHHQALPKFLAVAVVGLALNASVLRLSVSWLGMHYLFGQVFATGLVLLWNFCANKMWTFSPRHDGGSNARRGTRDAKF